MSVQTGMLCIGCNEILSNMDNIFGTSCGHLYHFQCLRRCYDRSTNCAHCMAYKPCTFKMFLKFGESSVPWEEQIKTIALNTELEETKTTIAGLEEKYKTSQDALTKLEGVLKKHRDALAGKDITLSALEEKLESFEVLNKFLHKEVESLSKKVVNNYKVEASDQIRNMTNVEIPKNPLLKENGNHKNHNLKKDIVSSNENELENKSFRFEETVSFFEDNATGPSNKHTVSDSRKIVINNHPIKSLQRFGAKEVVKYLASKMDLSISNEDINVIVIKQSKNASLIVESVNNTFITEFLARKNCLKSSHNTKYLQITEHTS